MADNRIEKLNSSMGAASKEAGADAADAETVPVVIPSAAADRELSDEDLDRVSGGATDTTSAPRRPTSRAL